jgi:UDP-glucose 4-epimerase
MKQKKILITGGTGFIGSNIANRLKKNNDVTIFDLREPLNHGLKFLKGSINEINDVTNAIHGFDIVIHLAASLGVINTEENPVSTLDTNIFGTRNVLEACKVNKIKKIIFSSSSEIYGEPIKTPIEEKDRPIPITMYGISKLAAEEYIKSYSKNFGLKYTIFRLFNVYGDKQETAWVVPEFVSRAIKNKDIMIHGDGTQIRAFSHVSDVAKAFEFGLEKGNNEIINIGNNTEPITIKDLADKIIRLSKSKSKINFIPFKESKRNRNEIIVRIPSVEKAKKILDFKPSVSLDIGLEKVIKYRRSIN